MSLTKKDQSTTTTAKTTANISSSVQQQEYHIEQMRENTQRMFDETKDNIQKLLEETRSQIPYYNQAINSYQEQVLTAAGEMASSYFDTHNAVIKVLSASVEPYFENVQNTFNQSYSIPKNMQDYYSQTISNITNNSVTVVRLINNTIFTNFDLLKTSWQQAANNVKEISKVTSSTAKAFQQSNRQAASASVKSTDAAAELGASSV